MLHNVVFGLPKNVLYLLPSTQTVNGITVQVAPDSLITLNGTATASTTIAILCSGVTLGSKQYTASLTDKNGYATGTVAVQFLDGSENVLAALLSDSSTTLTATGQSISLIQIIILSGVACSQYQIGLQMEAGGAATGWVSPGTQGVIFYPATGETGIITNSGNVDAYPAITITGACANPSVTNDTTGETIAVNIALGTDDTLVIDCRPATRGCYLNGKLAFDIKQGLGWIHCPPGNNVLTFNRDGYDTRRHCTIKLSARYL